MSVRGLRKRSDVDRGFPLSDHADFPGLIAAIEATKAERILLTHGFCAPFGRYLRERGYQAAELHTPYASEHHAETHSAEDKGLDPPLPGGPHD
jgi:putative mRNA 3-end processing factor